MFQADVLLYVQSTPWPHCQKMSPISSPDATHCEIPKSDSEEQYRSTILNISHHSDLFGIAAWIKVQQSLAQHSDIFPMMIPICLPQILAIQYRRTYAVFRRKLTR